MSFKIFAKYLSLILGALILGSLVASIDIYRNTNKSLREQLITLYNKDVETEDTLDRDLIEVFNDGIALGEVAIDITINGVENTSSYEIIDNLAYSRFNSQTTEDLINKEAFIREGNSDKDDLYRTGGIIAPKKVIYHIIEERENHLVSLFLYNKSEEYIKAEKASIMAIGVENTEGYYAYGYITVGTAKEFVHNVFKDRLKNRCNTRGYETYIDEENNFIHLMYDDNNRVISFMTGNTLGEEAILNAIMD